MKKPINSLIIQRSNGSEVSIRFTAMLSETYILNKIWRCNLLFIQDIYSVIWRLFLVGTSEYISSYLYNVLLALSQKSLKTFLWHETHSRLLELESTAWCKSGTRTPAPRNPGTRGPGPPSKFKSGTPGPSPKFKSGVPGPPLKSKSGTFMIIFLHCYIYNMEIISHE